MIRQRSTLAVAGMLTLAILGGCSHQGQRLCLIPYEQSGQVEALPPAERAPIVPDVGRLPPLTEADLTLRGEVPRAYHALTPGQAQCLSAEESALGNLLSRERSAVQSSGGVCHNNERTAAVMRRALSYASAEARNESAGDGLEAYYRLVEAEGLRDVLRESGQSVDETLREVETLRQRGVTIPPEARSITSSRLTLSDQIIDDDLAVLQLNSRLRELTGLRAESDGALFWPVVKLTVDAAPVDIELAVAEGLQMRPELNLLRFVERNLDEETLPVARAVLGGISGALGTQPTSKTCCSLLALAKLMCAGSDEAEAAARRRQLRQYRIDRERAVEAEIRRAVFEVEARLKQVAVAKERLGEAELNFSEATERQRAGRGSFVEATEAQTSALEARGGLVRAVVAWELARVSLREAQGLLIFECGGTRACP